MANHRKAASGTVAAEYCARFPATPSRTLARMLHRDQPKLFRDEVAACCAVRYHRGRIGKNSRRPGRIPTLVELPEPIPEEFKVHQLQTGLKYLVLGDIHVPYHDRQAIELAVAHGKRAGCNAVLLLGDVTDFYALSSFERDPRKINFRREIEDAGRLLDYLNQRLDPEAMIWKLGNHERRLIRFMRQRCAEFLDVPQFALESFMRLEERGVTTIESNDLLQCGRLTILHGHEFGKGPISTVNPARTALLRTLECSLTAHRHQTSVHVERTVQERQIASYSIGCLCGLHPEYAPLNKWNLGFAVLDTTADHDWSIDNLRIVNGRVH